MRLLFASLLLVFSCHFGMSRAAEPAEVRVGTHDGFDRAVFEFSTPTKFSIERGPNTVVLHFSAQAAIPSLASDTRMIKGITGGDSMATITLAAGAQVQSMLLDRRVVIDVRGASTAGKPTLDAQAHHAAQEGRASVRQSRAVESPQGPSDARPDHAVTPLLPPVIQPAGDGKAAAAALALSAPMVPVSEAAEPRITSPGESPMPRTADGPIAISATVIDAPTDGVNTAVLLPFAQDTGAAAFRHGAEAWLVFDEPRPIDAASFQDQPVFKGTTVEVLPDGTLVRFPLETGRTVTLRKASRGWIVTTGVKAPSLPPLTPAVQPSRLLFPVANPGHVVAVADPGTGQNLEVGTLRSAGPGIPVPYRAPEFNIQPSWQGVVLEPLSDRTVLRSIPEGLVIETGDPISAAADSARALADAAVLTRHFDFPALPVNSLLHRLQAQMADEGAAPPQDRLLPREAAAQTMLALGLGAEAQSLLHLAETEDPHAVDNADFQGLRGIAALMSGRESEASGLLDPRLSGTDEISLWRAVLAASRQEGSPEAARLFAATTKLILSYPAALRDRLLPLAAETMASGGAGEAADALLAKLPDEPRLAFARAIRLQAKGDTAGALTLYDALAVSRDRLVSARASARAVRLRLTSHAIGPTEAADQLERGFLDWRGDDRERDLRLEVVDLRAQAGEWRKAFSLLKETSSLYPEDAAAFRTRTVELLTVLLRGDAASKMSPLDLVTLAEENAEEAAKAAPDEVTALLADRLVALDLPKQAAPILERMLAAAPVGAGRAILGARLAPIRLAEGDLAKAKAALSDSDAPDLPPALIEQRGLIEARIRVQNHDLAGATALLAGLDTAAAADLRATILTDAADWHGAEAALRSLADRVVPKTGTLTSEQQDVLLRLASTQARAGDDDAARELGNREAGRMAGPRSDMFRLLTAAPVTAVGDLRRSAGELAMARAIPAGLAAMGSR